MSTVIVMNQKNPGCLTQLIWFIFIGWWVGQLWIALAWFLMLTILGIPLGVMMFNKIPKVIALRQPRQAIVNVGGVTIVGVKIPQRNIFVRIIYFVLIGWWFSAIWVELAYLFCLTILGLPIGFWMFDKTPAVLSLRRQ